MKFLFMPFCNKAMIIFSIKNCIISLSEYGGNNGTFLLNIQYLNCANEGYINVFKNCYSIIIFKLFSSIISELYKKKKKKMMRKLLRYMFYTTELLVRQKLKFYISQ